jgi:hypothetical protein
MSKSEAFTEGYLRVNPSLGRQWGEGILGQCETDPAQVPCVRMGPETPPSTAKTKFKIKINERETRERCVGPNDGQERHMLPRWRVEAGDKMLTQALFHYLRQRDLSFVSSFLA